MKRAFVTIVTANREEMGVFSQEVLPIEPQVSRGTSVEFPLKACTLALWRESECVAFGDLSMRSTANHSVLLKCAVEDIEGKYARLKGRLLEWVPKLTTLPWGHCAFYGRGPDGNVLNSSMVVKRRIPERVGEALSPAGVPTTADYDATVSWLRSCRANVLWASERSSR